MIMIVISFASVEFYPLAILYVLIVMQIKLVVVVVVQRLQEVVCEKPIKSDFRHRFLSARKYEIRGGH